jgi:hypothetical protein
MWTSSPCSTSICVSAPAKSQVAIKRIKDVFRDLSDAKRCLREVLLLRSLGYHENILWLLDVFASPPVPRGVTEGARFRDLYIVTDLMDTDLAKIIESPQPLSDRCVAPSCGVGLSCGDATSTGSVFRSNTRSQAVEHNRGACSARIANLVQAHPLLHVPALPGAQVSA